MCNQLSGGYLYIKLDLCSIKIFSFLQSHKLYSIEVFVIYNNVYARLQQVNKNIQKVDKSFTYLMSTEYVLFIVHAITIGF